MSSRIVSWYHDEVHIEFQSLLIIALAAFVLGYLVGGLHFTGQNRAESERLEQQYAEAKERLDSANQLVTGISDQLRKDVSTIEDTKEAIHLLRGCLHSLSDINNILNDSPDRDEVANEH